MTTPPITVRQQERAQDLVKLLSRYGHNGFPVVDSKGRFKGLVRRKQIVALMECGVFEKSDGSNVTHRRVDSLDTVASSSSSFRETAE